MPDQPYYKEQLKGLQGDWAVARWAADHVISLPMYPDMDDATQDQVIKAVFQALK
jgi:UDP-2-acetamido-2-deoxy-ribo-hexuluronate aminotransferase